MKYRLITLLFLLYCGHTIAAPPCTISLTYKENGKPGYMAKAPGNEGLYNAIYSALAEQINCQLNIKRYPKKRTHKMLQYGHVDLYPSTGFNKKRSKYLFYVPNGLKRYEPYFGLAPKHIKQIDTIEDIKGHDLIWIFEAGDTTAELAKKLGVPYQEIVGLNYKKAINLLKHNRPVFYRIIEKNHNAYLKNNNLVTLSPLNISTHKYCCEPKSQPLYLGISRSSNIIKEEPNPHYNPQENLSPENFPTRLVEGSIAIKIAKALKEMEESGQIDALYRQYIK